MSWVLPEPFGAYPAGAVLRDVTLSEARAIECNRCGDCCNGLRPGVLKDEGTGLPLFIWGTDYPADRYAGRFGEALLLPIVRGEEGAPARLGEDFERDSDGKPYTSFCCSQLIEYGGDIAPETGCALYGRGTDPSDLSTIRPRNCGEFPVFGLAVDDTIIAGHPFVPATGALPRCAWYGIRVVGPWKDTPGWRERWERQCRGEPVESVELDSSFVGRLLERKATAQEGIDAGIHDQRRDG